MPDPSFIMAFNKQAVKEGFPEDDPHSTILLKQAVAGGCKDPTV